MNEKIIMELLKLAMSSNSESNSSELSNYVGKIVYIQTVTHYYIGEMVSVDSNFIKLEKAAWVADSGRLSEMMVDVNKINEVEMFPIKPILVGVGAIVCITEYPTLPTQTK